MDSHDPDRPNMTDATHHTATQLPYRPDIDGLRALAVLSVLVYHFEFDALPGGFVGVDVFFVISGYLITRLIAKECERGRFDFKRFYIRRFFRLAPALIAVLFTTFLVSAVILTPDHLQRFSGALLASLLSISNVYFWNEAGYFDAAGTLKPVLHTWSLSVEEQFYLVWPAVIVLLCSRRRSSLTLPLGIACLSLASLVAAVAMTSRDPSTIFFLMPFRVYEFGLGALLACATVVRLSAAQREMLCVAGLGMIITSAAVYTEQTPFPGYHALLPCIGTAMVLLGGEAKVAGLLLRNPLSVWTGRLSYSLYLVHWPVLVLYKHISFADVLVGKTRVALMLFTALSSIALYHFVECRFRRVSNNTSRGSSALWLVAPLLLCVASAHAFLNQGWTGRFDPTVIAAVGDIQQKQQRRRIYIQGDDAVAGRKFDAGEGTVENVLVVGDSHATDMFNALYLNLQSDPRLTLRMLEIDDQCLYRFSAETDPTVQTPDPADWDRCDGQYTAAIASRQLAAADRIVYSSRWDAESFEHLETFVSHVQSHSDRQRPAEIVVMARTAEFASVPGLVIKHGLNDDTPEVVAQRRNTALDKLNQGLQSRAESLSLHFVEKLPFLCEEGASSCPVLDPDGHLLYTDYGHWTIEGARTFGMKMLSDTETARLLTGL